jgi:hypothetical protein
MEPPPSSRITEQPAHQSHEFLVGGQGQVCVHDDSIVTGQTQDGAHQLKLILCVFLGWGEDTVMSDIMLLQAMRSDACNAGQCRAMLQRPSA